jgi:hypothetical protein
MAGATYMGDVCVGTGKYTDQSGQEKVRYVRIGAWFESDQGHLSVKLDALPMPQEGGCWLKLFTPQADANTPAPQQQQAQAPQQKQAPAPQRRGRY